MPAGVAASPRSTATSTPPAHRSSASSATARTTSFRAALLTLREQLRVGDPIRFTLRGTVLDDAAVVAVERW